MAGTESLKLEFDSHLRRYYLMTEERQHKFYGFHNSCEMKKQTFYFGSMKR